MWNWGFVQGQVTSKLIHMQQGKAIHPVSLYIIEMVCSCPDFLCIKLEMLMWLKGSLSFTTEHQNHKPDPGMNQSHPNMQWNELHFRKVPRGVRGRKGRWIKRECQIQKVGGSANPCTSSESQVSHSVLPECTEAKAANWCNVLLLKKNRSTSFCTF